MFGLVCLLVLRVCLYVCPLCLALVVVVCMFVCLPLIAVVIFHSLCLITC